MENFIAIIRSINEMLYYMRNRKTVIRVIATIICTVLVAFSATIIVTIIQYGFFRRVDMEINFWIIGSMLFLAEIINEEYTENSTIAKGILIIIYVMEAECSKVKKYKKRYICQLILSIIMIIIITLSLARLYDVLSYGRVNITDDIQALFFIKASIVVFIVTLYILAVELIFKEKRYYFVKTIVLVILIIAYISRTKNQLNLDSIDSLTDVVIWAIGIIALFDMLQSSIKGYLKSLILIYNDDIKLMLEEVDEEFYAKELQLKEVANETQKSILLLKNEWRAMDAKGKRKVIIVSAIPIVVWILLNYIVNQI